MDNEAFALRLSKLREKRNVSAREMSLDIGQNAGYINNIETGKSYPSMSTFFIICSALGITEQDFFDESTDDPFLIRETVLKLKQLNSQQLELVNSLITELLKKNNESR